MEVGQGHDLRRGERRGERRGGRGGRGEEGGERRRGGELIHVYRHDVNRCITEACRHHAHS